MNIVHWPVDIDLSYSRQAVRVLLKFSLADGGYQHASASESAVMCARLRSPSPAAHFSRSIVLLASCDRKAHIHLAKYTNMRGNHTIMQFVIKQNTGEFGVVTSSGSTQISNQQRFFFVHPTKFDSFFN